MDFQKVTDIDQFIQQLLDGLWSVQVKRPSIKKILSELPTSKKGETLEIYLHFKQGEEPIRVLGDLTYEITRQFPKFTKLTGCTKALVFADGFRKPDEVDEQGYRNYLEGKEDLLEDIRGPLEAYLDT